MLREYRFIGPEFYISNTKSSWFFPNIQQFDNSFLKGKAQTGQVRVLSPGQLDLFSWGGLVSDIRVKVKTQLRVIPVLYSHKLFTPNVWYFYTNISAISETFCNCLVSGHTMKPNFEKSTLDRKWWEPAGWNFSLLVRAAEALGWASWQWGISGSENNWHLNTQMSKQAATLMTPEQGLLIEVIPTQLLRGTYHLFYPGQIWECRRWRDHLPVCLLFSTSSNAQVSSSIVMALLNVWVCCSGAWLCWKHGSCALLLGHPAIRPPQPQNFLCPSPYWQSWPCCQAPPSRIRLTILTTPSTTRSPHPVASSLTLKTIEILFVCCEICSTINYIINYNIIWCFVQSSLKKTNKCI